MSRKNKLITALLSIVLCFSIFTITAYAVDLDGDGIDDDVVVTDPPAVVETDPPYVEPETEAPYYEPETEAPYYEPETEAPYYEPEDPYNSDSSQIYYDSDNGGESSEFYVGGGQSYVPPVSTAPSAPLYDSNRKIDDSVLSNNDWKDISASLKNAGQGSENDSDDFGFIKNNDSLGDNGEWMLYTGIACLALSAAGIAYVIISSVSKHKKLSGGLSGKQYAYAGAGNGRYRSSSDYDDGYKDEKTEKRKIDKSRKFDTADVKLPKSSNGTRYKNGGKRYK
ncbi:hypothetical protein [Ruminococcus sp.]|uniref:hypothetical protein n=1 Tax=Ruminococcus sp. TaxID=41978 RepID=UPI003F0B57C5